VRSVLAVAQLSLALALLLSTGLMVRSFAQVLRVESGIRPQQLLTASLSLPAATYQGAALPQFYEELIARLRSLPGVIDAGVTSTVPFSGGWDRVAVDTGLVRDVPIDLPEADRYIVDPSYFATMGIVLRRGRLLETTDALDKPPVVVVDEVFARKLVPSGDALGFRMRVPGLDSTATVVGIVGHVKHYGLDAESGGQLYVSHVQYPWRWMSVVMRVDGDPIAYSARLRDAVRSLDADRPIYDVATMESLMAQRTAVRRFVIALLGVFAAIALVLASVGLYGVVAYTVAQRHREFGIRLALGSTPHGLARLVLHEGMLLVAAGVVIGGLLAAAGARLLRGFLFQVEPSDPRVAVAAIAILALTAAVASWIPARRAARLDPLSTIRPP
jgi:putative ABC transport system permease protein